MANLPGLVIKIGANTKGAIDGLNRVNRALGQAGSDADRAAARWQAMAPKLKLLAAGAAAAGAALTIKLGRDAVTAASDLNESIAKSDVVFGRSAQQIKQWAATSTTDLLMSKQAALEAAGTYGNLFQAFGVGQTKAADMSTTLVQLASDLASFNNTSVDDAITAIRSGLSGETEPLKRYGVALTDARLKQEALNLGIYDGKGILDAHQKSLAAYEVILKDTTLAQGDVKRTATGFANTMRALDAAVSNASATIGEGLVMGIQGASQAMGGPEGIVNLIDQASDGLANMTAGVGALAAGLGSLETEKLETLTARDKGGFADWLSGWNTWSGPFQALSSGISIIGENARITAAQTEELAAEFERAAYMADVYAGATRKSTFETGLQADSAKDAAESLKAMNSEMDKAANRNTTLIGANMAIRALRREGIDPSGGKKGKQITPDDARTFGLQYAQQIRTKYDLLVGEGKLKKAENLLNNGRTYIAGQVAPYLPGNGMGFAGRVLPKNPLVDAEISRRDSARGADAYRKNIAPIYNTFNIRVEAKTAAETAAMVQRLARLRALEARGGGATGRGEIDWEAVARAEANR